MTTPQRFLVATDFSAGADGAAEAAIALARRWKARIDWIHVCPEVSPVLSPSGDALLTEWVDRQHKEARVGLDALKKRAEESGVESELQIHAGRPDVAVARVAEETRADWVIVGTHGHSGIRSLLIGSVAEKIVRNSPVSVLCVRPGASLEAPGVIVFGEDFTSREHRQTVAELAGALDSRVVAVHGVELAPALMADASFSPPPALLDASLSEARERLAGLADQYGKHAETRVSIGAAADALCDHARRLNASLLVTGASSRKGIERWMLGSVAERVLRHAPCSVLVLRP